YATAGSVAPAPGRSGTYLSPLTQSRCSRTASLRATAITARFFPRLPPCSASFIPHRRRSLSTPQGAENMVRSLHQECSQVRIALFADVHLRLALSRVTPSRLETNVAGGIPALAKTVWIFQRQHIGEGD